VLAAAVLLAIDVAVFAWLPRHVFWNPDEGAKYFILHTIGWDNGLTYALPYRGARLDPELRFYPRRPGSPSDLYPASGPDGSIKITMPLWFPWLTMAPFRLLGISGLYIIPLLSGFLTALVAGWLTYSCAPALAPLAILAVGLGTPVCFYSFCFWEHTLATLLGTTAVALLVRPGGRPRLAAVAIALLTTLTLLLRLEMIAFAVALLVGWAVATARRRTTDDSAAAGDLRSGRRLLIWGVGIVLAVLVVCALPLALPLLPTRHYQRVLDIPQVLAGTAHKLPFLADSVLAIWINLGGGEAAPLPSVWAWAGLIGVLLCFVAAFIRAVCWEAAVIVCGLVLLLAVSFHLVSWPLPYRAVHGVFPIAPAIAFFAYGLTDAWRRRAYALLTLATAAAAYLLIGTLAVFGFYVDSAGRYDAAFEWGPRFLLTLYPLMTVLTLVTLQSYWRSQRPAWLRRVVVVLVVFGLWVGGQFEARGILMLHDARSRLASLESTLPTTTPVVTDVWWLPSAVAPFFVTHEVYYAAGSADLRDWIALAKRSGVDTFVFVGEAWPNASALARVEQQEQWSVAHLQLARFRMRRDGDSVPAPLR
jgi:hypothetical protein